MEKFNTTRSCPSDEELLLSDVIAGDAELLYLDSYLSELFRE